MTLLGVTGATLDSLREDKTKMGEMMLRLGCSRQLAGPGSDVNTRAKWERQLCKAMASGEIPGWVLD